MTRTFVLAHGVLALGLAACGDVAPDPSTSPPDAAMPSPDGASPDDAPADTVAPTVTSTMPADDATGVSPSAPIVVTFSEPMRTESVALAIAAIGGGDVAGTPSWDAEARVLTLHAPLAYSTSYVATIASGAQDTAGNAMAARAFRFTTGVAPDTEAPALSSSVPEDAATGVAREPTLVVRFSEPMDVASVEAAFAVASPAGITYGPLAWSEGNTRVDVPFSTLPYDTAVTWRVTTAARDLAGNALPEEVARTFRVRRLVSTTLYPALDGTLWSTGAVDTASDLTMGDLANGTYARAILSFDLSALPENLIEIQAASVQIHYASSVGNPFNNNGGLRVESIDVGPTLTSADFTTASLGYATTFTILAGTMGAGQTAKVIDDWTNRAARGKRSQIRLRFNTNVSANDQPDSMVIYSRHAPVAKQPTLLIRYEAP